MPSVRVGKPNQLSKGNYKIIEKNDIQVYINVTFSFNHDTLDVDVRHTLFGREMYLKQYAVL